VVRQKGTLTLITATTKLLSCLHASHPESCQ
jgi:hypothetical protein